MVGAGQYHRQTGAFEFGERFRIIRINCRMLTIIPKIQQPQYAAHPQEARSRTGGR